MKYFLLIFILSNSISAYCYEKSTMRERRMNGDENYFEFTQKSKALNKIDYKIRNRAKDLHRKAVQAFYLSEFKDSEACFSLSMQVWSKSPQLLFEFSLCSSLYPKPYRSFDRAVELKKMFAKLVKNDDSRIPLLAAVMAWQKGDIESCKKELEKIQKGKNILDVKGKILKNIGLKKPLLDNTILVQIMPEKLSSSEKRSQRNR
jgi:hypothetical protein